MTSERLRQIEQLYHRALEQEADSRTAFVAEACGDDEELRQEVESLLAESRDDAFLETPIVQAAAKARAHNEAQWNLAGKMLTHYRVINQIGAGGMGVVYLAHDETLGREVTIKVLNPVSLADRKRYPTARLRTCKSPCATRIRITTWTTTCCRP